MLIDAPSVEYEKTNSGGGKVKEVRLTNDNANEVLQMLNKIAR
jgi:hypothetical protein